jgi:hypothetical protein
MGKLKTESGAKNNSQLPKGWEVKKLGEVCEILDKTPQFPCFILTSFDSEAVTQGEDVNIVYIKGLMNGDILYCVIFYFL